MGTVPYGNPGGMNQTSPSIRPVASMPTPNPIAGGGVPSSSNPYMFSTGITAPPATVPGAAPAQNAQANWNSQLADIYGATGGMIANEYQGLQGTNNAAYQALVQSMAPTFQQQRNNLMAGYGASGVGANSTVAALGESDLATQQGATLAGLDAQMIMQNQQERLGLLQGTEQAAIAQQAQDSGWGIFGNILNTVGGLATT